MEILVARDIRKSFRGDMSLSSHEVLHGVSLYAVNGEILGFLGPNGAGKTTTIKIILGLLKPDSGTVTVYDKPISDIAVRSRVGYLPESPYLFPHLTLEEFLRFCGELSDMTGKYLTLKIKRVLSLLEMERYADLRLKNFSKGMTQKAALAQAILHDPDLLILDEPFSGLDPLGRKKMKDILVDLKNKGKTIFFSSHILSDMEALCDRTYIIKDGSIVRSVNVEELFSIGRGRVEITARRCTIDDLREVNGFISSVSTVGEELIIVVDVQEHVKPVVGKIYESGGDVLGVEKQHLSLEEVFLEEVRSDNNGRREVGKEKITV